MNAEEYIKRSEFANGFFDNSFNEQSDRLVVTQTRAMNAIALARQEVREEYEERYKHIEETLEAIIYDCQRLTSGNVSHHAASIQGFAQRRLEYIRKHKKEGME